MLYSRICILTLSQLANKHIGINNVVKTMKTKEIPSNAKIGAILNDSIHVNFIWYWNSHELLSNPIHRRIDSIKVNKLIARVHCLPLILSSNFLKGHTNSTNKPTKGMLKIGYNVSIFIFN